MGEGRNEAPSQGIFHDVARHHELEEIIRAAGLGADAGHLEASEGMAAHDSAGAASVYVEVPGAEALPCFGDVFRTS